MSQASTSSHNSIFPLLFLIGITAVLVVIFMPPVVRTTPLPVAQAPAASAAEVAAAPEQPAMDTSSMDHLTLMAMGLEEVNASSVQRGGRLFTSSCTACHGYDARGIAGLGKTMIGSAFVNSLNDDELVAFISVGRAANDPLNSTGQVMPARGGNMGLTDEDLHFIVDYIRSLNGATVIDDIEETTTTMSSTGFKPLDLSAINAASVPPSSGASGTVEDLTALAAAQPLDINALDGSVVAPGTLETGVFDASSTEGAALYMWSCAGCHGADGAGVPGLPYSSLAGKTTDAAMLLTMLTTPTRFEASAAFVHPVRGGYPVLSDEQVSAIIAYLSESTAP